MSDIITVGNASQLQDDDVARDVNIGRSSRLAHKETDEIFRSTGIQYGGHIIWKDSTDLLVVDNSLSFTNNAATKAEASSTITTSLAGKYPKALQGLIKGAVLFIFVIAQANATKVLVATSLDSRIKYAVEYNAVPSTWNIIASVQTQGRVDGVSLYATGGGQAVIPVKWVNNIPYITWNVVMTNSGMDTNTSGYYAQGNLYLQGFTV